MFCELKSLFFFLLFFHYSFSFAFRRWFLKLKVVLPYHFKSLKMKHRWLKKSKKMISDRVVINHTTSESHNINRWWGCHSLVIPLNLLSTFYVLYGILWVQLYAPSNSLWDSNANLKVKTTKEAWSISFSKTMDDAQTHFGAMLCMVWGL